MKKPRLSEMPQRGGGGSRGLGLISGSSGPLLPRRLSSLAFPPPPQAFQIHFLLQAAHDLFPKHSAAVIWETDNAEAMCFCRYLCAYRLAALDSHEDHELTGRCACVTQSAAARSTRSRRPWPLSLPSFTICKQKCF